MKLIHRSLSLISLLILSVVIFSCDSDSSSGPNTPSATVAPATSSMINASTDIVISFSQTMNRSSISSTGSMTNEFSSVSWSTVTLTDDTLTISPDTSWSEGGLTLIIDVDSSDGVALEALSLSFTVDSILPVASVLPANNTTINSDVDIVVTFDESMDPGSHSLGNSMAASVGASAWSSSTNTNDVLTISTSGNWPAGSQGLDVSASDLVSNSTTVNLNYTVNIVEHCSDGIQNQDESDIDCGGAICGACGAGEACLSNSDCGALVCNISNMCEAEAVIQGCTFSTATDMTGQSNVTVTNSSAWSIGHSACIIVDVGTNVTWQGNFSSHPLVGGVNAASDAGSPITNAGPGADSTPVVVTFSSAGDYGYFCGIHTGSMTGAVFVR